MTPPTGSHNEAVLARAHGTALTAGLTAATCGGDLEPALTCADAILVHGFYTCTRGELLAAMLYRLQLIDYDTGTSTAEYFALSKRLVEKGVCAVADMKSAVCGGILMREQERGWLEPQLYDMLAHAARGRPDWQIATRLTGDDLFGWMALRRVSDGVVTRLCGCWLDRGRRAPGHIADTFTELLADGLIALAEQEPGGTRRLRDRAV